VSEDILIHLDI